MAGRVIQHQQDLLARQVVPPASGPGLQPGRDLLRRDPGRQQQAGQRVGRVHRPLPGVCACSGRKNCPSGKVGQPVRRVHRQGGLADPGHPADRVDPHHPARRGRAGHRAGSRASSASRPVKLAISRGSVRVAAADRRRASAGGQHLARRRPPARRRDELLAGRPGQPQRPGQQPGGVLARGGVDAPLQVTDRPLAQAAASASSSWVSPASPATAVTARRNSAQPAPPLAQASRQHPRPPHTQDGHGTDKTLPTSLQARRPPRRHPRHRTDPASEQPGGPRNLAASRRFFRFGLQFSDGGKATASPGGGRPDHDSEPAGPVLCPIAGGGGPHSFISRWWMWPLPPAGPLELVCGGWRSASPNPGPASTRGSSSTRPGAASGYGRKMRADGGVLAARHR